uniref:Uncharacterized protein n=1 Tax=Anguilla anguilla TaxID=7936 RepID=A0A0E9U170_ANGAN
MWIWGNRGGFCNLLLPSMDCLEKDRQCPLS